MITPTPAVDDIEAPFGLAETSRRIDPKEVRQERVVHARGLLHHRVPEGAGRFQSNHTRHDFLDDGREAATRQTVAGTSVSSNGTVMRGVSIWLRNQG